MKSSDKVGFLRVQGELRVLQGSLGLRRALEGCYKVIRLRVQGSGSRVLISYEEVLKRCNRVEGAHGYWTVALGIRSIVISMFVLQRFTGLGFRRSGIGLKGQGFALQDFGKTPQPP